MAHDGIRPVVRRLLEALASDPYGGLYASLVGGSLFVSGEGYVNLVHQVDLFTEYLVRDPVRLLVADEIGLGKTVEALRLVKLVLLRLGGERALVVVPASLLVQWREEDARGLGVPMTVIDRRTAPRLWEELRVTGSIPPGVYVGSMDTLKLDEKRAGAPYWELVSSVDWDLVVVDEAHKLGVLGGRPSLRYKRIGSLCERARHCLLLTATPTRGDPRDLAMRLRLLEPGLDPGRFAREVRKGGRSAAEALRLVRSLLIVRRGKEVLRYAERSFRVPDAVFLLGLVQLPRDEEEFYESVYSLAGRLLKALGSGPEIGLMRALLVKRALSSPLGFARTLRRIVGRAARGMREGAGDALLSMLYEDEYEPSFDLVEEPDRLEESLLAALPVEGRLAEEARHVAGLAEEIAARGDAAVRALAGMLAQAPSGEPLLAGDRDTVYPNVLVFTEYLDTLEYIRSKLADLLPGHGLTRIPDNQAQALAARLARGIEPGRLRGWAEAYRGPRGVLLLYYVSSRNSWIIPGVADAVRRTALDPGISIAVISTDVAGEGLNLQGANILVNYEVTWSMVRREQRIGRVWRIGQKRRVYVIDLVRATPLEKAIYERLLSKIYMLSLATGSPLRTGPSGVALIRAEEDRRARVLSVVSPGETSPGRVLEGVARALERLPTDRPGFMVELDRIAGEIMRRLDQYRAMARLLQGESPREYALRARRLSHTLYGAETHEDAEEAVRRLAEACALSRGGGMGEILARLAARCGGDSQGLPVALVSDEGESWDLGALGLVRLGRDGRILLELPVLALSREGQLVEALHGYEAVRRAAEILGQARPLGGGMISLVPGSEELRRGGALRPLEEAAGGVASRVMGALAQRARSSLLEPARMLRAVGLLDSGPKPGPVRPVGIEVLALVLSARPLGEGGSPTPDRLEVERAGIEAVRRLLEARGYDVEDVHEQGLPYDLVARPRGVLFGDELLVEVKAHRGARLSGTLTEREARKAEEDPDRYIVCLVAFATSGSPLVVCRPYREWRRHPYTQARVEHKVVVTP